MFRKVGLHRSDPSLILFTGRSISSLYKFSLSLCLVFCIHKCQILWGTLRSPGHQGRFMNDQNFKYLSPSKFDFHKILKNLKNPRNFLLKSANFFCFVYDVHKENMFTIKREDRPEAPLKASISKYQYIVCQSKYQSVCLSDLARKPIDRFVSF